MSETSKRESLSSVDAAWRHMEDPTNLMMVTGVMHFQTPVPMDALRTLIEKRLLRYARFRQKVVDVGVLKHPHWEDDPEFNLDNHLSQEVLPEPGDAQTLQSRVSELMSLPLDWSMPLWHFHLIDNVEGGNAIMVRIHHCIADGMALVALLLSLTGESPEASLNLEPEGESPPHSRFTSKGRFFQQAGSALKTAGNLVQAGLGTLVSPEKWLDLAKAGSTSAKTTANLVFRKADPDTPLKGPLNKAKLAAWSRPVQLEHVKAIRKVTKTTVNDVLITAMTGGLRRYLATRETTLEELCFHAAVPVNLRPLDQAPTMGNQFGLVFLPLPVNIEEPLERLWEVKKRMDHLKTSNEAVIVYGIIKAVGLTPAEIQKMSVNLFGAKATCVMTNVPGPKSHLYLAGKRIDTMMFWVPCSGKLALGISIFSYAGEVRLGVATDQSIIPDPHTILDGFHEEFQSMLALVEDIGEKEKQG